MKNTANIKNKIYIVLFEDKLKQTSVSSLNGEQ